VGLWLLSTHDVEVDIVSASHHFFLALCYNKQNLKKLALVCVYGDPHHQQTASIWAQVQNFVVTYANLPVICMGDLNNIMHTNEKLGPSPANAKRISEFCCMIKSCGLFDLGYNGPVYTWTNKRFSTNPTYERLDRFVANAKWCAAYPTTSVYHLPMMKSDHAPILALLESSRPKTKKPFCFENWWLLENDFQDIAKLSWHKSISRPFHQKVSYLVADLKVWRKSKPKLSDQLQIIENFLTKFRYCYNYFMVIWS
jgi:hypothetical protein